MKITKIEALRYFEKFAQEPTEEVYFQNQEIIDTILRQIEEAVD